MKVFLSYHRSIAKWPAMIIERYLKERGADVFLDTKKISSGRFENVILNEIGRREHFVVILAPESVARLGTIADWVAREINHALEAGKNIIPVLVDGAQLAAIPEGYPDRSRLLAQNALEIPSAFLDEALAKLYDTFLSNPTIEERENYLAEEHFERASAALAEENWSTVVTEMEKATSLSQRPEYFLFLAVAMDNLGRTKDAIPAIDTAISLDPFAFELMNVKFQMLQRLEKIKEAIDLYSADWSERASRLANEYGERVIAKHRSGQELANCVDSIEPLGALHRDQADGRRQLVILQDLIKFANPELQERLRSAVEASSLYDFRDLSSED